MTVKPAFSRGFLIVSLPHTANTRPGLLIILIYNLKDFVGGMKVYFVNQRNQKLIELYPPKIKRRQIF